MTCAVAVLFVLMSVLLGAVLLTGVLLAAVNIDRGETK